MVGEIREAVSIRYWLSVVRCDEQVCVFNDQKRGVHALELEGAML